MKRILAAAIVLSFLVSSLFAASPERPVNEKLTSYIETSIEGFDQIPAKRKALLRKLASWVEQRLAKGEEAKLTYICTHNSRRSHMSQIWGQTAAAWYGIPHVTTFSGGTEATAFNPRAVAALTRAGFEIEKGKEARNPVYDVKYKAKAEPMKAFSKVFDKDPNPSKDFCAVMTCSDADKKCPLVLGAAERVAIPYEDPKAFDGTEREAAAYDERCRQISTEMLFLFSQVNKK